MLVPDYKQAWRWLSVQSSVVVGLLAAAYDYLPAIRSYFPEGWVKWAVLLIIAARLIAQKSPVGDTK